MEARRAFVRWFFGTMVVFPTIAYVFSGAGIYVLGGWWFPSFASDSAVVNQSIWLAIGLLITFALFSLSVNRWGAPPELWVVAAAWSVLHLVKLLEFAVFVNSPVARDFLPPATNFIRFFDGTAFRSVPLYFAAIFAYLGVAAFACWAGIRWRMRREQPGLGESSHA